MELNPEQARAVKLDGNVLVVACPGSGKTGGVIVPKTIRLLKEGRSVVVVTFTREAANELEARITKAFPNAPKGRLQIGTFHSTCRQQLRGSGVTIDILEPAEQAMLVKRAVTEVVREFDLDLRPMEREDLGKAIDLAKRKTMYEAPADEVEASLFEHYQRYLAERNKIDLQDSIAYCTLGMREGTVSLLRCTDLLIDEFQDTDSVQLDWALEYAQRGINLTAVGDDDQSIFAFRRSLGMAGMQQFRTATNATVVTLATNYRSKSEVLTAAGHLISNNENRQHKDLVSYKGPGGRVVGYEFHDAHTEIRGLVEAIKADAKPVRMGGRAAEEGGARLTVPEGSWAVLARTNASLVPVILSLIGNSIEFRQNQNSRMWERAPLVQLRSLLQGVAFGDAIALHTALIDCGFDQDYVASLEAHWGKDPVKWIKSRPDTPLPGRDADAQRASVLLETLPIIRQNLEDGRIDMTLDAIYHLIVAIMGDKLWESAQVTLEYGRDALKGVQGDVATRLARVTSVVRDKRIAGPGVALFTLHGAKGLEFDKVWIIRAEQGQIPGSGETAEERRLMYVGVTRARNDCTLSWFRSAAMGVRRARTQSQFIGELQIPVIPVGNRLDGALAVGQ